MVSELTKDLVDDNVTLCSREVDKCSVDEVNLEDICSACVCVQQRDHADQMKLYIHETYRLVLRLLIE